MVEIPDEIASVETPDKTTPLSEWTNAQLMKECLSIEHMVRDVNCYGTSDLRQQHAIESELDSRGFVINEVLNGSAVFETIENGTLEETRS